MIRHIELLIRRNHPTRRLSARAIFNMLGLNAGTTTVKLALKDLGYRHCIARRRLFLKKKDRKRRLQFAKRHAHLTVEVGDRIYLRMR